MLLQIFAACPAPLAPAWITALPISARNGSARSNASPLPPTMKVRLPAFAAAIPPETGASTAVSPLAAAASATRLAVATSIRSEEHTSELQSLMRISYAVFCLKKKKQIKPQYNTADEYNIISIQNHKKDNTI